MENLSKMRTEIRRFHAFTVAIPSLLKNSCFSKPTEVAGAVDGNPSETAIGWYSVGLGSVLFGSVGNPNGICAAPSVMGRFVYAEISAFSIWMPRPNEWVLKLFPMPSNCGRKCLCVDSSMLICCLFSARKRSLGHFCNRRMAKQGDFWTLDLPIEVLRWLYYIATKVIWQGELILFVGIYKKTSEIVE